MTWLKLSDDFTDDTMRLSDAAFRAHVEALAYIMRRNTGPVLTMRDVRRCMDGDHFEQGIEELIACGFWIHAPQPGTVEVIHHMAHQPTPEMIRERRQMAIERQARWRNKKREVREERSDLSAALPRPDPTRPDPGNGVTNASRNASRNASTQEPSPFGPGDPWEGQ